MNITFPLNAFKPLYYDTYFKYVLNMFLYLGYKVTHYDNHEVFRVIIDDKEVFFDYADDSQIIGQGRPNFKFHYRGGVENMYAFSPPSFYNWEEYYSLIKTVSYKATGYVSCRQVPYATGRERRLLARRILGNIGRFELLPQSFYLQDIKNCLVSVCAPGHNAHILDRGQFQYMGLGVCTISPSLPEILPFNKTLMPGVHYLECKEDFSDLLDIIEWCKLNTQNCIEIGQNAQQLFQATSTPEKVVEWIKECIWH